MNLQQRRFVEEYLIDLNATAAATRAGYSGKTARSIGQRLLTNVDIADAINTEMAARAARTQVRADEVLRELIAIVKTNPSHFTTDDAGNLATLDPDDTESWRAVASVKTKTRYVPQKNGPPALERVVEYKLWDKNSAIDKAMRHLGILSDRVDITTRELAPFTFAIHSPSGDLVS